MSKLKTFVVALFLLAAIPAYLFTEKADIDVVSSQFEFYTYLALAVTFTLITGLGLAELTVRGAKYLSLPKAKVKSTKLVKL